MRLRVRAFGVTLLSLTFDRDDVVVAECYEVEQGGITGGAAHNFERAGDLYCSEPEERFGFR